MLYTQEKATTNDRPFMFLLKRKIQIMDENSKEKSPGANIKININYLKKVVQLWEFSTKQAEHMSPGQRSSIEEPFY